MDPLIVISVIVIVIVGGFLIGRYSVDGRSAVNKGSSVRPITSKKTEEEAFRLALSRIGAYLRENVDRPLSGAFKDRRLSLRRAAEDAVAAIADLNFFLGDPSGDIEEDDLTRIVKEAVQDYEADWNLSIRLSATGPVQVRTNTETLLDALYLILHNAAVFGHGKGVVLTVSGEEEWGKVLVKDEGPGFTPEALSRACEPFYTTAEGSLGLGLSHARRVVELQKGWVHLRNGPDGGAEVEIAVPLA